MPETTATTATPMTHADAVALVIDAIVNPPPPMSMSMSRAKIDKLRDALLAITAPPELLSELGEDLRAIRRATPAVGESFRTVEMEVPKLAHDQVPLEQQVAAWQAMALRISEEKARLERNIAVVGDDVAGMLERAKNAEGVERAKILAAAIECAFNVLTAFSPRHNFDNAIRVASGRLADVEPLVAADDKDPLIVFPGGA